MLFVVDIGLIGFLAMHAYQDGITLPHFFKSIPILTWWQLMAWIGLKFHFLGDWRVLSWILNETGCMISIHLKTGAIALQDTHVVVLVVHWNATYLYNTKNQSPEVLNDRLFRCVFRKS